MRVRHFTKGGVGWSSSPWMRMKMHTLKLRLDPCRKRHDPGNWEDWGVAGKMPVRVRTCNRCSRVVEMKRPPAVS